MAFEGSIEDLPAADVLQLLHVSQKSGVLMFFSEGQTASIMLRNGAIVSCRHPDNQVNIGNILIDMGATSREQVLESAERQKRAGSERKPLIGTLVEMGYLSAEVGWEALKKLVEATFVEIVGWQAGNFVFEAGEPSLSDSFEYLPDGIAEQGTVDTQATLMEAVRILDERNAAAQAAARERAAGRASLSLAEEDGIPVPPQTEAGGETRLAAGESGGPPSARESPPPPAGDDRAGQARKKEDHAELVALIGERLTGGSERGAIQKKAVLLGADGLLKRLFRSVASENGLECRVTEFEQDVLGHLSHWREQDILPILVVDISAASNADAWLRRSSAVVERVRQIYPEVPITILCGTDLDELGVAFALGATTVLPRAVPDGNRETYVGDVKKLCTVLMTCLNTAFSRRSALIERVLSARRQTALLRQRVLEISHPNGPSDISLIVLRHVADAVQRCVLFLPRHNDLVGLGAFGVDESGETISGAIAKLRIPIAAGSLLAEVVRDGRLFYGERVDPLLRHYLYGRIAPPESPAHILLPLRTRERTAALIYGDFGDQRAAAIDTDGLEIIAAQAGMAFELALLDRTARARPPTPGQA